VQDVTFTFKISTVWQFFCSAQAMNRKFKKQDSSPVASMQPVRSSNRAKLSRRKLVAFSLFAALLFAFLFITGTELLLRAVHYGYPVSFFLPRQLNGEKVVTDNPRFGWRFFPPSIARRPHDFILPLKKKPREVRVFVFGESAAWGDPDPSFGFWRILNVMLSNKFPDAKIRVMNTAMAAINSHVIREIARQVPAVSPDIYVVYMGNNEVIGPFGPGTSFHGFMDNLSLIRDVIWLKSLKAWQLAFRLNVFLRGAASQPQEWAGMQMFEKNKISAFDPRLQKMYRYYRSNLRDIVETGKKAGADVFLCSMAANLRNCAPFASMHKKGPTPEQIKECDELLADANEQTGARRLSDLEQAEKIDPTFAEIQFQLARAADDAGNYTLARKDYQSAVDYDALRFRSDTRINQIIREESANLGVKFLDITSALDQASTGGITGANVLVDHVHMNFHGNYLIAKTLFKALLPIVEKRTGSKANAPDSALSEEQCAARLAYTNWNRFEVADRNTQRVTNPPFTGQSDNKEQSEFHRAVLERWRKLTTPPDLELAITQYRDALSSAPDDWILHENFADLLQHSGHPAEETKQLQILLKIQPQHQERNTWLGQSLATQSRFAEADQAYRRAIEFDPTDANAYRGIGDILIRTGRVAEGIKQYEKAAHAQPGHAEGFNELGEAYYRVGRVQDAEKAFAKAVQLKPTYALAQTNLAAMLIEEHRQPEARKMLELALKNDPDLPDANRFLGNLEMESGQYQFAIPLYERVLLRRPDSADVYNNLAAAYSAVGRIDDAIAQFQKAVKLQPSVARVRKNLGLLLAQRGQKSQAVEQLIAAAKLDPGDPETRGALESLGAAMP
jgi:tetratricopeptide (TPR) repeat protein